MVYALIATFAKSRPLNLVTGSVYFKAFVGVRAKFSGPIGVHRRRCALDCGREVVTDPASGHAAREKLGQERVCSLRSLA